MTIFRDRVPFGQGTDGQDSRAVQEALPDGQRGGEREKSAAFGGALEVRIHLFGNCFRKR